ncbi:YciI family protein [Stieleria sp. TO1_6]|uniref:YciI family protein n=1 Tax=Stieleria tagensis TaxID=2956795 RepID=UPI00209B8475|nr:YciI family protein [Stieleria tagensis]MCO8123214.1 YciI family protein [Stieleria tagensis]
MKFICLGYADQSQFEAMSEEQMCQAMQRCFDYDDVLRAGGHFVGGEALQSASDAVTLRMRDAQVQTTDGPFAETKEQLGGILILEADDMQHAVELMSKHPGVEFGPFEIRPADQTINELVQARDKAFQAEVNDR